MERPSWISWRYIYLEPNEAWRDVLSVGDRQADADRM